ncbi:MAG: ABC transporter permease subunit [Oscillospiraceae bacterium]|jgi:L-cystine transport system permease protein|nr:ABC transporter permease subunit [Oscillospiraceae bacterium]
MDLSYLWSALQAGAGKILPTVVLALVPFGIGVLLGLPAALGRYFRVPVLKQTLDVLVSLIKGIPVLLMLMAFYVISSQSFDSVMQSLGLPFSFRGLPKGLIAGAALAVYAAAALSEVFRGALASVPKGQYDAAYACGLSKSQAMRRIILPQVLPVSLPMGCNIMIALIKSAALGSLVSFIDVMNAAVNSMAASYRFLEAYIAAALIYWGICVITEQLFKLLEHHFARRRTA